MIKFFSWSPSPMPITETNKKVFHLGKHLSCLFFVLLGALLPFNPLCCYANDSRIRILVVSSYHPEYDWSQETHAGFCDAMFKLGYFDNRDQVAAFSKNNKVETSKIIIKKKWLDSKRRPGKAGIEERSLKIYKKALAFRPGLVFVGDDNAAKYIGKLFLDSPVPLIFWGINMNPLKYDLVETVHAPGHNITGVYQRGYYMESLAFLKKLVPAAKTFAILSVDTPTGRAHHKAIEQLAGQGKLPIQLVSTVATSSFEKWKQSALALQSKVDAFFLAHYAGLKDSSGNYVKEEDVARWYLTNIKKPETVGFRHYVEQGMLCGADDSGYNQGYEAVLIAHDILAKGAKPAAYPPRAPKRGPLLLNRHRAETLGIAISKNSGAEQLIETAAALKNTSQ